MRDPRLRDLINTLERFHGGREVRISLPSVRGRVKRSQTFSEVGSGIRQLREDYGMTLVEIAAALSHALGTEIAFSTVALWERGGNPRKVTAERVCEALDLIRADRTAIEGGAWVEAEEVQGQMECWTEVLTTRQIAVAANEPLTTVNSWRTGFHRVLRTKWRRIKPEVDAMADLVAQSRQRHA